MRRLLWAPAVLVILVPCASAWAAPATVNLRVEGGSSTIFEGPVTTDAKTIAGHPCDGTTRASPPNPGPGPTMTSALDDASLAVGFGWTGEWFDFGDFLIGSVGGESGSGSTFWGTVLNREPTQVGGCQQQVADGDDVLFALGDVYAQPLLALAGDSIATVGRPAALRVTQGAADLPYAGASVTGLAGVTGSDGIITGSFDSPGIKTLKAHAGGAIRSNAWQVCVELPGSGTCSGFLSPLTVPKPAGAVQDSSAPAARIRGPRNGRRYRRGPRLLEGTARDDGGGVSDVKLSIRRHAGGGCRWWSGRRDRFVGHDCRKTFFFSIGKDAHWSYLMPRALGPGRYVVDVKAFDARRNRNRSFVRGENRIVFEVLPRRAARAAAAAAAARVEVLVAGRERMLAGPVTVRARAASVRASGRRCAVGASTPLAALVAALERGRIGYRLKDFGSCSPRRSRDSGQLFVNRIGRESNRGQDGWVYKVDDRALSRGAADGRVRPGARVAWLFCRQQAEGGCQRSLRVLPAKRSGLAGEPLRVRVLGYDDRGRGRAAAGAQVTLRAGRTGIATAPAAADGTALLTFPGPGSYRLAASAAGLVPSFPVRVGSR